MTDENVIHVDFATRTADDDRPRRRTTREVGQAALDNLLALLRRGDPEPFDSTDMHPDMLFPSLAWWGRKVAKLAAQVADAADAEIRRERRELERRDRLVAEMIRRERRGALRAARCEGTSIPSASHVDSVATTAARPPLHRPPGRAG